MERWSEEKARAWWDAQPWIVGINYVTSDAVNDVEMWMDATFNPSLIRKELKVAESLGFNSIRVFMSYIVWKNEERLFENNFDKLLEIANECHIRVLPLLFDDCAFDFGAEAVYGKQPNPVPGVCLSRWVPSPGFTIQDDSEQLAECEKYVEAIIGKHRDDPRILAWDLYNEPGNANRGEKCFPLLQLAYKWARKQNPIQPITSGTWNYEDSFKKINDYQITHSDVISFHTYSDIDTTKAIVEKLAVNNRPLFLTEWLHRPLKSLYETHLPLFYEKKIGIWQWGMIVGKNQTNLWWETMNGGKPNFNPDPWQHDILYPDLTPYRESEIALLKSYTFGK